MSLKNILFFLIILLLLSSCKSLFDEKSDCISCENALIPKDVIIMHEFAFKDTVHPDWLSNFDGDLFTKEVFTHVKNEKIKIYQNNLFNLRNTPEWNMVPVEINTHILEDTIISLMFLEKWFLHEDKLQFNKEIMAYAPVRKYLKGQEKRDTGLKEIMFWIQNASQSSKKAEKQIAEDIYYMIDLENLNHVNFDKQLFFEFLIKKIINNDVDVYDFFSNEKIAITELKKRFGFGNEKVAVQDPVTGVIRYEMANDDMSDKDFIATVPYNEIKYLIFKEDWYVNNTGNQIKKEVKTVALVREYEKYGDMENGKSKEILFSIHLH